MLEAVAFISGIALVLALPAGVWALIAGRRLARLPEDFKTMSPGLLLLCVICAGTMIFPFIAAVALGTDMPPIWGLQGLFLFVIVAVCMTSYPIERFHSVNLSALVLAIAVLSAVVIVPIHALYRNFHPLSEGRNFYQRSAVELIRRWHEQSDNPLLFVGGDDGLAFAAAFYSPDHPQIEQQLVYPYTEKLPPLTTFEQGWAALCFSSNTHCVASMGKTAARFSQSIKTEFVLQSRLLGQPGASEAFTAFVVLPSSEETVPLPSGTSEDFSALRRTPVHEDE
jgi:hypothetical protein